MKYIDAEKLIDEIERLKERYGSIIPKSITAQDYQEGRLIGYEDALYKIKNSLQQEQPEVDLEKEIDNVIADYSFTKTIDSGGFKTTVLDYAKIARHFYELGLNARKK